MQRWGGGDISLKSANACLGYLSKSNQFQEFWNLKATFNFDIKEKSIKQSILRVYKESTLVSF